MTEGVRLTCRIVKLAADRQRSLFAVQPDTGRLTAEMFEAVFERAVIRRENSI